MDDLYCREFPPAAQAKVKATKIWAARDFETARENLGRVTEVEVALRAYVLQVFLSFAEQAFELGRQGVWSVGQIDQDSREFLRRTAIEAGAENGFDRWGHRLSSMISNSSGAILPEVQREFEKSPEWKRFTDGLLDVAELQAGKVTPGSGPRTFETGPLAVTDLSGRTDVPAIAVGVQKVACPDLSEAVRPLLNVELINQLIGEEGYTNIELAEKLHLSPRALTSMRKNQSYHGRSAVQKLANLMGRDATELYLP
jgi:hypothetical protein